ncbi:MAG: hypothetical protein ABJH04_08010 [Cyclobacteriaceae bacterium]
MKLIYLRENIEKATMHQILVREKDFKALQKMQYSGGFKRFDYDIYDEGMKVKHRLKDSQLLSNFLKTVFQANASQPLKPQT